MCLGEIEIVMSTLCMMCWPQQHSSNKLAQRVGPQEPDSNFGKHRGQRNTLNDMTPGKFRMLGISAGWPTQSLQQEKKEDCTSLLLLLFSHQVMSELQHTQASLSFTFSQNSPKFMSIELVMPSNHLILDCPLLLLPSIFPSIRVFSNESSLQIRWPKYWSFSFSISPSNEWVFRVDFP